LGAEHSFDRVEERVARHRLLEGRIRRALEEVAERVLARRRRDEDRAPRELRPLIRSVTLTICGDSFSSERA